jgi:hypothetical protein
MSNQPRRLSFSSSEARQLKYCSPPWEECEEAAELGRPSMAHGEEVAGLITAGQGQLHSPRHIIHTHLGPLAFYDIASMGPASVTRHVIDTHSRISIPRFLAEEHPMTWRVPHPPAPTPGRPRLGEPALVHLIPGAHTRPLSSST